MAAQTFYGTEPHSLLWVASRAAHGKIIRGILNSLNYCIIFIGYTKCISVAAGRGLELTVESDLSSTPEFCCHVGSTNIKHPPESACCVVGPVADTRLSRAAWQYVADKDAHCRRIWAASIKIKWLVRMSIKEKDGELQNVMKYRYWEKVW
jgi:hypothetical protein